MNLGSEATAQTASGVAVVEMVEDTLAMGGT
jgi:hypothetical protein